MEKQEIIQYWLQSAGRDWEVVRDLARAERYVHALFFAHLVVEKLLKAHWINEHEENVPPRVHNLNTLYDQLNIELPPTLKEELPVITSWNIAARYQDYKDQFFKMCTAEYSKKKLFIVEELISWLTRPLQSK